MRAHYGETEIETLLGKVRIFDSNLGKFELFAINGSFDYVVKLSNGTLYMTVEDFQADANRRLTPEILTTIAGRFREKDSEAAKAYFTPIPEKKEPQKEKSGVRSWITLAIIILFLVIGGIAIAELLNNRNTNDYYQIQGSPMAGDSYYQNEENIKSEEELQEELRKAEQGNPQGFIDVSSRWNITLLGDCKITGTIQNESKLARYKNIIVKLSLYNISGDLVDDATIEVSKFIEPGETVVFDHRLVGFYGKVTDVKQEVLSAEWY